MNRRGWLVGVLAVLALVIAVQAVGAGERDIAELLYGKGEKAYRKKAYEEAAGYYERALEEASPYPEAAFKLGMSLEKLGRGKEALDAYLLAEKQFGQMPKLTRKQKRTLTSVQKNISRIGAGYAELSKLDAEFVRKCVALSRRYFNSRPAWAKKAAESALAIDPGNELAKGFLEKLGSTEGPAVATGLFSPLIQGDGLDNWEPGVNGPWACSGGVMNIDTEKGKGQANYVKKRFEGSYEVQASFRPLVWDRNRKMFGMMFAHKTDGTAWGLLFDKDEELVLCNWTASGNDAYRSKIVADFRANRWYRIGLKVEGPKITAYLNGKQAFTYTAEEEGTFDGFVGVIAQNAKVEVKEMGERK